MLMAWLLSFVGYYFVPAIGPFRQPLDVIGEDVTTAAAEGKLTAIQGIGTGIASVVTELVETGHSQKFDAVRGDCPETLLELFDVPGLGIKRIRVLYSELGVADLDALEQAARSGAIRALPGFGPESESQILRALPWARRRLGR